MKFIEITQEVLQVLQLITDAALKYSGNQVRPHVNFIENAVKEGEVIAQAIQDAASQNETKTN